MKKIALLFAILFGMFVSPLYAMKEPVVDEGRIESVIEEAYPHLVDYYEAGLVEVVSMTEETLIDGSKEYNIRYRFVRNYCEDEKEIEGILREKYPRVFGMLRMGLLSDVHVWKYVDQESGEIETGMMYNFREPRRHFGMRAGR